MYVYIYIYIYTSARLHRYLHGQVAGTGMAEPLPATGRAPFQPTSHLIVFVYKINCPGRMGCFTFYMVMMMMMIIIIIINIITITIIVIIMCISVRLFRAWRSLFQRQGARHPAYQPPSCSSTLRKGTLLLYKTSSK